MFAIVLLTYRNYVNLFANLISRITKTLEKNVNYSIDDKRLRKEQESEETE